jgi:hypothetical protein
VESVELALHPCHGLCIIVSDCIVHQVISTTCRPVVTPSPNSLTGNCDHDTKTVEKNTQQLISDQRLLHAWRAHSCANL